jgi:4-alpha-glucanotransferase
VVAGVPPDYFSESGQLWGNPLYNWEAHAREDFAWWIQRMKMTLSLADIVRLDHFRGFEAAWEVPAHHTDARNGTWVKGPGDALFDAMRNHLGGLPLIAEDLGVITDEVRALRDRHNLPGMHVLQFGFEPGEDRCYAPHRASRNCVVYTGTHDNDTTNGWYRSLPQKNRAFVQEYLNSSGDSIHWPMIRAAYGTVADTVIIPMQDVLGQSSEARMNTPGLMGPCWTYRLKTLPDESVANELRNLTQLFER